MTSASRSQQTPGIPERALGGLFHLLPDAVLTVNAAGIILSANEEANRLFATRRQSLAGREFDSATSISVPIAEVLNHHVVRRDVDFAAPDDDADTRRFGELTVIPLEDTAEPTWGVLLHDVTERERARQQRTEQARQVARLNTDLQRAVVELEAVLDVVPVGVGIARDPECRDIRVNPAFAAQLGIPVDINASKSAPGGEALPFRVMQDGVEVPADQLPMQRAAREGVTIADVEYDIVHADGRVVRLLEYAAPLRDATGRVWGSVGVFVDITERSRLVAAERTAREEAERANRAKSEFLAAMSHELRTPLNAIGGYVQLLELGIRGPVSESQRDDLDRIRRSQEHLLGLINDVLNFARLEAGRVQFEIVRISIPELLTSVESMLAPQVRARGHRLVVDHCENDLAALADSERVAQIMVNLLTNAVKYTEPGGQITVACSAGRDDRDRAVVRIQVSDTGVGIPDEKLTTIFEPFIQVGRDLRRPSEGVGLGLAISRDLARQMDGDLTCVSEVGKGSTFTLTIPQAPEQQD